MNRTLRLALPLLVAPALACTPPVPPADQDAFYKSPLVRDTPSVPADDAAALEAGNAAFARDLYRSLPSTGNLFFSPWSVSLALAQTYAGARTSTATEMAATLHFTLPDARLHAAFNAVDEALATRGQGGSSNSGGDDGKGFRLSVVNALWTQRGFTLLPSFLDVLAQDYGTGMHELDFAGAADAAVATIDAWVSAHTGGRIPQLLQTVPQGTDFVLTDAVYFNAAWADDFDPQATQPAPFRTLDGRTVTAATMHGGGEWSYATETDAGWQAVAIPYDGGQLSMLVVVPDGGAPFDVIADTLDVDRVVSELAPAYVTLSLPKWTTSSRFSLVQALESLGMKHAFGDADFSGIDGGRDISIADVIHQARVTVDENGTEAAAATAVIAVGTAVSSKTVTLDVATPFLYFIRDDATGAILFAGRVADPTAN